MPLLVPVVESVWSYGLSEGVFSGGADADIAVDIVAEYHFGIPWASSCGRFPCEVRGVTCACVQGLSQRGRERGGASGGVGWWECVGEVRDGFEI